MTLQVAKIAATTAAIPYGTLQIASVQVGASVETITPTVLQVSSVAVSSSFTAITPTLLQVAKVAVSASRAIQPPVVTVNAAQTLDAGQVLSLAGTDTDPSGTIASRAWRLASGAVSWAGASTAAATFTAPPALTDRTYTFAYKVTSSTGLTTEETVTHTVLAATERVMRNGVEVPFYFL